MVEKDDKPSVPIMRVDTVPPPEGEDDAYSAPTKVGPMNPAVLDALREAAEKGTALKPQSLPVPARGPGSNRPSASPSGAPASGPISRPQGQPRAPDEVVELADDSVIEGTDGARQIAQAQLDPTASLPPSALIPSSGPLAPPPLERGGAGAPLTRLGNFEEALQDFVARRPQWVLPVVAGLVLLALVLVALLVSR